MEGDKGQRKTLRSGAKVGGDESEEDNDSDSNDEVAKKRRKRTRI